MENKKFDDYINNLSKEIHEETKNAGWWDDPDRCIFTAIQMISTEVAEATEGVRKFLMDTKLPHYPMEVVELADVLIRVLDLGGKLGLTLKSDVRSKAHHWTLNTYHPSTIGKQHLAINVCIVEFALAVHALRGRGSSSWVMGTYCQLIKTVIQVCMNRGYTYIWEVIDEKRRFNASRPDHTREHRATKHGKKF